VVNLSFSVNTIVGIFEPVCTLSSLEVLIADGDLHML
jgi:hypothetical protein